MNDTGLKLNKFCFLYLFYGILIFVVVYFAAFKCDLTDLGFKTLEINNFSTIFGCFFAISIFVERTTEVFLSLLRSRNADILDNEIVKYEKKLESYDKGIKQLNKEDKNYAENLQIIKDKIKETKSFWDAANVNRINYRSQSRYIALWIGLIIGLVIALTGVRLLGYIVILKDCSLFQKNLFACVDILITGAILSGGSEAFNRIMKVYNTYLDLINKKGAQLKPKSESDVPGYTPSPVGRQSTDKQQTAT